MKQTKWTEYPTKINWTVEMITDALREAQIGDQFCDLNHLQSTRFRRIGNANGLRVEISNDGNMLNAGIHFVATVKGRY